HVPENRYYVYIYHVSPDEDQVQYKYEYERDTDTLLHTYEYDVYGRLVSKTDSEVVHVYYVDTGRIKTKILLVSGDDPAGTIFSYSNDPIHNVDTDSEYGYLTMKINPDLSYTTYSDYWSADQPRYVKEYDAAGNLLAEYEYDADGNLVEESEDTIEEYGSGLMKRKIEGATLDIYEYREEDWDSQGYGRVTLIYDASETTYRTYDWGAVQVTVDEYEGEYEPGADSDVRSDVIESERVCTYVYDHNDEQVDLDTLTNGWVLRQQTVYDEDGVTVAEEYIYDETGRLTRDDHISENRYYTYTYYESPNEDQQHYKYEYEISTAALIATYEYNTAGDLVSITYPGGGWIEKYTSPDPLRWKREVKASGIVSEYTNEYIWGDTWSHFGRQELYYDLVTYQTWDWIDVAGSEQVLVTEFSGDYVPIKDSANKGAIDLADRTVEILYDRDPALDDNGKDIETQNNGWIEREKSIYDTNGVTILEKYLRDEDERLIKDIHTEDNAYYTYVYHDGDGIDGSVHYKKEYTYDEAEEDDILEGTLEGTLLATYEYIDDDYMTKWGEDGTITTLLLDNDVSYNNTYLNTADGILHIYNWDGSWNLLSVRKEYPDGTVEICTPDSPEDPVWPLAEKREPVKSFIKGVNMPWVLYGYDIGLNPDTGEHEGFSRNLSDLYEKMDARKGDYVRVFLFSDLRAGINFDTDGTPLSFTDKVYEDMQALLDCAEALGIKVMPVLFDYLLGGVKDGPGAGHRAEHADLIDDADKRKALIDICKPFIEHFKDHEAIHAWDIMNEPEGAKEFGNVEFSAIYDFLREFADMIHEVNQGSAEPNPDLLVTVGSQSRAGMLDMLEEWDDEGYSAILDLCQFHYYNYMEEEEERKHLEYSFTTEELALLNGIPIIAGELEPTDIIDKLDILLENGYIGGLFWEDGNGFELSESEYEELKDWFYGTICEYNDAGQLIKEIRPDGAYKTFEDYYVGTDQAQYIKEYTADGTLLVTYEYDIDGNLVSETGADYTYYASGRVETKTLKTASGDDAAGTVYTYYDNETRDTQ
ncbi:MAG: hypothetical protein DRP85_09330, partial [Candidatus Makaraimicrobium thalassicum]